MNLNTRLIVAFIVFAQCMLFLAGSLSLTKTATGQTEVNWVTADNTYIHIENSFYDASIRKNTTGLYPNPYLGAIEQLTIKPRNQNILANATGRIHGIGHEYQDANGNSTIWQQFADKGHCRQISPVEVTSQTTEYAVIHVAFQLSDSLIVNEWKTFYYDKPWIYVTYTREWQKDIVVTQNQICFLFQPQWRSNCVWLSKNGSTLSWNVGESSDYIRMNRGLYQYALEENFKSKPWIAFTNSTYGEGAGVILLDSTRGPMSSMDLEGIDYNSIYAEFQIGLDLKMSFPAETNQSGSYLICVFDNNFPSFMDDWTDLRDLAQALYRNQYDSIPIPECNVLVSKNGGTYSVGSNGGWVLNSAADKTYFALSSGPPYQILNNPQGGFTVRVTPFFSNSSATNQNLWSDNLSLEDFYEDENHNNANITWTAVTPNGGLNISATTQFYGDSDKVYLTLRFATTDNCTLKQLGVRLWDTSQKYFLSNSTSGYAEASDEAWGKSGYAVMMNSGLEMTKTNSGLYILALNNTKDTIYAPNTNWVVSLLLQSYQKTASFNCTSDFTDIHQAWWNPYKKHYTGLFNWGNNVSNEIGFSKFCDQNMQVLYSNLKNNTLSLLTNGEGTLKIFIGNMGEPSFVSGTKTHLYDPQTSTIEFETSEKSLIEITWEEPVIPELQSLWLLPLCAFFSLLALSGLLTYQKRNKRRV
jgi:hypothetical protein